MPKHTKKYPGFIDRTPSRDHEDLTKKEEKMIQQGKDFRQRYGGAINKQLRNSMIGQPPFLKEEAFKASTIGKAVRSAVEAIPIRDYTSDRKFGFLEQMDGSLKKVPMSEIRELQENAVRDARIQAYQLTFHVSSEKAQELMSIVDSNVPSRERDILVMALYEKKR